MTHQDPNIYSCLRPLPIVPAPVPASLPFCSSRFSHAAGSAPGLDSIAPVAGLLFAQFPCWGHCPYLGKLLTYPSVFKSLMLFPLGTMEHSLASLQCQPHM